MDIIAVDPTVLLIRREDTPAQEEALAQLVDLTLRHDGAPVDATVHVHWDGGHAAEPLGRVAAGGGRYRCAVPALREPADVRIVVEAEGLAPAERTMRWTPPRRWEVHLVHISRHDWGYTDLPSNVWLEQDRIIETALRYCDETDGWPEETRFRYTVEQGWSALHFLESHPEQAGELIRRVKEGRIELTALYANETTELCGHEELVRLLYPSFALRRAYGVPIRTAMHDDIPGMAWGLALVLAAAGVAYFVPGLPTYFSWGGREEHDFWDERAIFPRGEPGFFRWEAPDGARVLCWYSKMWQALIDSPEGFDRIATYLTRLQEQDYPIGSVRIGVNGGGRDNAHPSLRYAILARQWNETYAYPRLIMSSNAAFFDAAAAQLGPDVPVFRGDLPNTDYTVGATSTALETAVNRVTHDHLTAAEKFATLAAQVTNYRYPRAHLDRAYRSLLLFDDHTWGLHSIYGPAQSGNLAEKKAEAYRAAALAHDVVSKSLNRIADEVALPDEGYHLLVFNPLNWERAEPVRHQMLQNQPSGLPLSWTRRSRDGEQAPGAMRSGAAIGRDLADVPAGVLDHPFDLVDTETGTSVPHQIVTLESPRDARPDAARRYAYGYVDARARAEIRFVAAGVPALGYKTYRLVPHDATPAARPAPGVSVEPHALENRFYRIELDPRRGTVARIYDKELGRELVDEAAHEFNEVVGRHPATGQEARGERSTIRRGLDGPVCGSLVVEGSAAGCPVRVQEIALYADVKRVDVATRLLRDASPLWEIYIAFPFRVEDPRFRYEGTDSVVEPLADQLPGSNSDAHAVQHLGHGLQRGDRGGLEQPRRAGRLPGRLVARLCLPGAPRRGAARLRAPFSAAGRPDARSHLLVRHGRQLPHQFPGRPGLRRVVSLLVHELPARGARRGGYPTPRFRLGRLQSAGDGGRAGTAGGRAAGARALVPRGRGQRRGADAQEGRERARRDRAAAGNRGLGGQRPRRLPVLPHRVDYATETDVVEEDRGLLPLEGQEVIALLRPHGITTIRCVATAPIMPG